MKSPPGRIDILSMEEGVRGLRESLHEALGKRLLAWDGPAIHQLQFQRAVDCMMPLTRAGISNPGS